MISGVSDTTNYLIGPIETSSNFVWGRENKGNPTFPKKNETRFTSYIKDKTWDNNLHTGETDPLGMCYFVYKNCRFFFYSFGDFCTLLRGGLIIFFFFFLYSFGYFLTLLEGGDGGDRWEKKTNRIKVWKFDFGKWGQKDR